MPYEAYQCFLDADIWKTVGTNSRRMWADFISTTIGEWLEIIVVVVFVPAELASYFLPLTFAPSFTNALWERRYSTRADALAGEEIFGGPISYLVGLY